ncbi:MAG: RNA polymerase sigma factor [Oscillospiraceae bacterium]|nr:RNA polymerase sigma factor [Oscillospiraceae bacterium]
MKKQELLKLIDEELLEKLYGFCYSGTNDSWQAQDLCSDIVYALLKAANTDGDVTNPYAFIWRIARNVYADFSKSRRLNADMLYEGDPTEKLEQIAADDPEDDYSGELITAVYRRISFLTKSYREAMIMFYIDGLSTAEIAHRLNTSETAIRQRLFSARQKIRKEVEEMTQTNNKPVFLDKMDYEIWGNGNPLWSDPRNVCTRQFSKHVIWLCRQKPRTAAEIAEELNVPTVYVEEELEILTNGENGKYGLLRRLENGRYAINFILLDKETIEKAHAIYTEHIPAVSQIISDFIEQHKEEYLAFPYLNKKVDLNLILWQQINVIGYSFGKNVYRILSEKYFADIEETKRDFHVFGFVDTGKYYGGGNDGVDAYNVCGYSHISLSNIYIKRIKQHFACGLNVSADPQLQLAIRSINGLDADTLTEAEKEHAAKAIECGYLYRDGKTLYTKILVSDMKDSSRLHDISWKLSNGYFEEIAEETARKVADLIKNAVPDYLLGEWKFANDLAGLPMIDLLVEELIKQNILTPPADGIGAEGCWMCVAK